MSVTSAAHAVPTPGGRHSAMHALDRPRFTEPVFKPRAVEIGNATHRLIELLDPNESLDPAALRDRVDVLVRGGHLSTRESQMVDLTQIEWLQSCDVYAELRGRGAAFRRELDLFVSQTDEHGNDIADCDDRVLLRGRVDLLAIEPQGLTLIDFKTDRVPDAAALAERVALYTPQVRIYATSLRRVTARRVVAAWLIFLHVRRCVRVPV
jgi:ATP-dependent helicase/nuclease subunit A